MRFGSGLIFLCALILSSVTFAIAQNSSVENLRSQLNDLQAKETDLQNQMKQLDEALKPENIESYFALNGSTHPEELREQRRKQLAAQKASVQAQLDQIAISRTRLEAAISSAEAAAARQGIITTPSGQTIMTNSSASSSNNSSGSTTTSKTRRHTHRKRKHRARSQQ